ncbi:hypothetical protein [Streptomyces sp. NPDC054865]
MKINNTIWFSEVPSARAGEWLSARLAQAVTQAPMSKQAQDWSHIGKLLLLGAPNQGITTATP